MYNRNIKEAIKHMELLQEQLASLEQRNDMLTKQLNTAICLLCSNKTSVVKNIELEDGSDHYITSFCLQVEALDGDQSGAFSPEATPYQAVLTGIDEYIDYMPQQENTDV
jgi:hypothetical protein